MMHTMIFVLQILKIVTPTTTPTTLGPVTDAGPPLSAGSLLNITQVPYILRLVINQLICTGNLIHESWLLTAAHCIKNPKSPETILIYAGFDDTSKQNEAQMRKGKLVIIHNDYMPNKVSKYDFALVEAEQPFEINKKVRVLELSDEPWPQGGEMYSRRCFAAGWGADDIEKIKVNQIKALSVTARHGEEGCKCFKAFHNRRLICLDHRGQGICRGDSGSALLCENKGVGVAHIIYPKKSCDPFTSDDIACKDSTGAYMYICPQLNWINEYVPSVPKTPPTCRAYQSVRTNTFLFFILFLLFNMKVLFV